MSGAVAGELFKSWQGSLNRAESTASTTQRRALPQRDAPIRERSNPALSTYVLALCRVCPIQTSTSILSAQSKPTTTGRSRSATCAKFSVSLSQVANWSLSRRCISRTFRQSRRDCNEAPAGALPKSQGASRPTCRSRLRGSRNHHRAYQRLDLRCRATAACVGSVTPRQKPPANGGSASPFVTQEKIDDQR